MTNATAATKEAKCKECGQLVRVTITSHGRRALALHMVRNDQLRTTRRCPGNPMLDAEVPRG